MDHIQLFAAVKALVPGMKVSVDVEVWDTGTTWQIYLSAPGIFYRGATSEEAFEAFKVAHAPKIEPAATPAE